jgi:hypothetical protein
MSVEDLSLQTFTQSQVRLNFLDLSRELRDYCYELTLTSPTPITLKTAEDNQTITSNIPSLASNLLQCNTIIAHEAASVFYSKNKFHFTGDWTWDTLATWLEKIGPSNRASLSSIESMIPRRPSLAWQKPDRERHKIIKCGEPAMEPACLRNRHLYRPPDSTSEGIVEIIHPDVERFLSSSATKGCRSYRLQYRYIGISSLGFPWNVNMVPFLCCGSPWTGHT